MTIKEKKERAEELNEKLEIVESALDNIEDALSSIGSALDNVRWLDEVVDLDGRTYCAERVGNYLDDAESEAEDFKNDVSDLLDRIRTEIEELEYELAGVYAFEELSGDALLNAINKIRTLHSANGVSSTFTISAMIMVAKEIAFDCGGNIISVDESEV